MGRPGSTVKALPRGVGPAAGEGYAGRLEDGALGLGAWSRTDASLPAAVSPSLPRPSTTRRSSPAIKTLRSASVNCERRTRTRPHAAVEG